MDIPRSDPRRRRRPFIYLGIAIGVAILVTLGISRLEPAAPRVDRASLWIDSVRRGPMVREVRGLGTLVPEEVRWIPAASEGRVEKILVQPGATVKADTVLVELSNSELDLQVQDALSQLRGAAALDRMGLSHRAKHLPAQLSGGQQQRVAVARALVGEPKILLADEPTGNLDSKNGEAVMELLSELHRSGATLCMVTHDPRFSDRAQRTVRLFDGRIVNGGDGSATEAARV